MTFNSEFKRIFGDTFSTEGFQYCSKLNAFVKMLSEDLMAFFAVKSAPAWNKGNKGFNFDAGIVSVYNCYPIDKKTLLCAGGMDLSSFVPRDEMVVSYEYNGDTMEEVLSSTALYLKERLIPIFDKVYDLNSFIDFLKEYSIFRLRACDSFAIESLVLIKTDNHDDFQTYFKQHLDELYARIDSGNVGKGYTKEMAYDDLFHGIIESIVYPRDRVYSDKNLYNKALEEAERRKTENLKRLCEYKIIKTSDH